MNNQLTQIDEDLLDNVAGGLSIEIGPRTVGRVIGGVVDVAKGTLETAGNLVKGAFSLIPSIKISFGR